MEKQATSGDPFEAASRRIDPLFDRAEAWMESSGEALIRGLEERVGQIDRLAEQDVELVNRFAISFLVNLHVLSLRSSEAISPVLKRVMPIDSLAELNITYGKPESEFLEIAGRLTSRNFSGPSLKEASPERRAEFARFMAATYVRELLRHVEKLDSEMISDSLRRTARQIFLKVGVRKSNELVSEKIDPEWSNGLAASIFGYKEGDELNSQLEAFVSEPPLKK